MFIYSSVGERVVIAEKRRHATGSYLQTWLTSDNSLLLDTWVTVIDSEINDIEEAKNKYPEYFI